MKTGLTFLLATILSASVLAGSDKMIKIGGLDGLSPYDTTDRYSISLALSGGGARGLATIGVLRAFEENNIQIKAIAGTSMGGIIGGLYASGYSPDRLEEIVKEIEFDRLFSNAPTRSSMFLTQRQDRGRHLLSIRFNGLVPVIPKALTAGQKLTNVLTNLTTRATYLSGGEFDHFSIPFRTVCTDVLTGDEVILSSGSLSEAMRSTMAFPLAFTGVEKDEKLLMDGGMLTPVPVELVKSMAGSDIFSVAINSTSPLLPREKLLTPVDIANQVTSIMTADKLEYQLGLADYVIKPVNSHAQSANFKQIDSLIQLGYNSGLSAADSIITLIKQREKVERYLISSISLSPQLQRFKEQFSKRLVSQQFSSRNLNNEIKSLVNEFSLFELNVEIITDSAEAESTDSAAGEVTAVDLVLTGFPRPLLSELTFRFIGNTIFDEMKLAEQLEINGLYLSADDLKRGLDRVLNLYFIKKHDLTDISEVNIDADSNLISITIDEAIIKKISVEHNDRTRGWFIKSYFPMKVGVPYSTNRAARGLVNIYGTDLFDRVMVDLVSASYGAHVKIAVVEKKYQQLRLGWHWDDHYNSETLLELLDDNVLGIGLEYLLHARLGPDRRRFEFSLKTNRIGQTYLTAAARIYRSELDRQLYTELSEPREVIDETKTGFEVSFGQQIARLGTLTSAINLEEVKSTNSRSGVKEQFGLRVFKLESLLETFNSTYFPNSGEKLQMKLHYVGKFLGGDVEYTRFYANAEKYIPITNFLNFHPQMAVGISRSGLPLSEKFFMGGDHTFYGFHTGEIYGDKIFLMNYTLRASLPLRLYLSARYDVGDVYRHTDEIKLKSLRQGIGFSVAYSSPFGPIEFGYGVTNDEIDKVYFSAGLHF